MSRNLRIVLGLASCVLLSACGHAEEIGKERPPPSQLVGLPCNSDNDCEQHCALGGHNFPDGFCTLQGCRSLDDCPSGTVCISTDGGVCVYPCEGPLDCTSEFLGRGGYTCRLVGSYNTADTSGIQYKVCIGD